MNIIPVSDVHAGDRIRLSNDSATMRVMSAGADTCNGAPAMRLDVEEGGERYRFFIARAQRVVRVNE